uniref:Odorant receptor n=1 Tax=Lutzomyia longipalpis TaxID=7200 RepID=A0A3F2ZDI7_LUTLO
MVNLQAKEEFLKITKFIYFSIRLVTFDCGFFSKNAGKFLSLFYIFINIYLTFEKTSLVEQENILELCLGFCTIVGLGSISTKVFTVCYYEDEIVELFTWIENFYFDNTEPILVKLRAKSLDKILWILKLFLKFYISFIVFVVTYVNFYYLINDIQVINIPWGMPKTITVYLQLVIYFSFTVIYGIPIMCFGCLGIIFIEILNFFNESIALLENSEEESLDNGFILILHKLHCEIYGKFCIYESIFAYSVFFDLFFNTTSMIGIMLLTRLYPDISIFYIIFITLASQILIYCIFGELIFTETEKILESLYMTKWYDLNREDKRAILLLMMMSSRPFGLKAAGMYNINIILFVQIIKLGFSYCAILYAFL